MGRYYTGDIEGKFAFAVQPSNDADFFGALGVPPTTLEYFFDEDTLPEVKKGIKKCEDYLFKFKSKLDEFFKDKDSYNREELQKFMGVDEYKLHEILQWDARLTLGKQIKKCIEENGQCYFEAEL